MKKNLLLLLFLITSLVGWGQNASGNNNVVAIFSGDKISLDKEISSKTISFTLKNLNENTRASFEEKSKTYSSFFTLYYPNDRESNSSQIYVLTLLNKTEFKMLKRLFISADVNKIEFNGKLTDREDFFEPFMK